MPPIYLDRPPPKQKSWWCWKRKLAAGIICIGIAVCGIGGLLWELLRAH